MYLPDTIPCRFKELIITPDTVIERWQKGYVVWQTWSLPYYGAYSTLSGTWATSINKYQFSQFSEGIFRSKN